MTLAYFLPAIWGLVLLVSFIGYGKLLRRLLFAKENLGWANEGAWGMALIVALGGLLNLFYLVSPPLVLALIFVGVACSVVETIAQRTVFLEHLKTLPCYAKEHPYVSALRLAGYVSIITLIGIQYLGSVTIEIAHANYIIHDDLRGYFLFPKQMLEAGGITADPFNSMRLGNGLAGQAVLHAFMLVFFDFFNLLLVEAGVSLIICAGLIWRIAANRGLRFPWQWALVFLFLCLPYYPSLRINTSSFASGMLMLLALFAFLDREGITAKSYVRNAFIVGMLAACASALKTTFLPPVVVILGLSYLWYLVSSRLAKESVRETALVPLFTLVMLLPWMMSLYNSSGTLLYHILGTGFDEFNYGNYIDDAQVGGFTLGQKLKFIYLTYFSRDVYLMLLIAGTVGFAVAKLRQRAAAHFFALGTVISSLIILLRVDVTKTVSLNRYMYGVVFVSLIVVMVELMTKASRCSGGDKPGVAQRPFPELPAAVRKFIASSTLAVVVYLFFWQFGYIEKSVSLYRYYLHKIPQLMTCQGTFFPEAWIARYRQAQESVPEGETILSRDTATAAYDFGRNNIYYLTLPGSCSPPPGLPYFAGPDAVVDYLLSHDIRYVAYNYSMDGGFPIGENIYRLRPDAGYFNRIFQRATIALDRVFDELGATRARIYDDGSLFILDLKKPASPPRAYRLPNYFQSAKILTPALARTTGFDRNKIWTNGYGVIDDIYYRPDAADRFLVLNTFGYHPWKGDMEKLQLGLSVNGRPLPFAGYLDNSYFFSLAGPGTPITSITIDSSTFVPREENIRFGKDDDRKTLGIDVDSIEIKSMPR